MACFFRGTPPGSPLFLSTYLLLNVLLGCSEVFFSGNTRTFSPDLKKQEEQIIEKVYFEERTFQLKPK